MIFIGRGISTAVIFAEWFKAASEIFQFNKII